MPPIRFFVSKHCTLLTASIYFNREIISPYSRYTKKGLMCITIISLASRQPSFYFKYIKANTYSLYNIRLVPLNKYRFLRCAYYYVY